MNSLSSRFARIEELEDRRTPAAIYALDAGGTHLLRFDSATPGTVSASVPVSGLLATATESLVAIDFRPATGQLYALGLNETISGDDEGRIYQLDPSTGKATQVGTTPFRTTLADTATSYGFDFDPVADAMRVVNDADQNFSVNADTGALISTDSSLTFVPGDVNTGSPDVAALAYTSNTPASASTTLLAIDSVRDRLLLLNPAAGGTLNNVGPIGLDSSSMIGFDVAADGTAFVSLTPDTVIATRSQLATINPTTGAVNIIGSIGGVLDGPVRDITVLPAATVSVTSTTLAGTEGDAAVTVELVRNGDISGTSTVDLIATGGTATTGSDFTGLPATVIFNPGETKKTVSIALPEDTVIETPKTVILGLANPSSGVLIGKQSSGTLTITDNDVGDTTPPTVTINQAVVQTDPTSKSPVAFDVVFSEPVTGFDSTDVVLSGDGSTGALVSITGTGASYQVFVSGMTQSGPITATIPQGAASDLAGNPSVASTSTDNQVTFNFTPPVGIDPSVNAVLAVGAGKGQDARVRVYDAKGAELYNFTAFEAFQGGVRVATGDFNGDGVIDVAYGTGPGTANTVKVLDGKTRTVIYQTNPFETSFTGGVYLAAGDVTGDGRADLIVTPDEGGGPRVRVFNGNGFTPIADFLGIEDKNFRGGARASIGDVNGDTIGDIAVAAGFGGGPRVAVFNGATLTLPVAAGQLPPKIFGDFFVFEPTLRNGVYVTLGDLNGDRFADVIVGGGPGGGPRVYAVSGADLVASQGRTFTPLANFFSGNETSRQGVRVAVKDLDGDLRADIVTGAGDSEGQEVNAYFSSSLAGNGSPATRAFDFDAFGASGGVFVG